MHQIIPHCDLFFKKWIEVKRNGFIACGTTTSPQSGDVSDTSRGQGDIWIVKIDSSGNKLWDKRYGGSLREAGIAIQQDFDGGYWIAG